MAKNTYTKDEKIGGLFLYKVKNQIVYHDFLSKNGYVLSNKDMNKFSFYQMRLPFAILTGSFFYIFKQDSKLSLLLGLLTFICLEIAFRVLFLRKLPVIKDFKRPENEGLLVIYAKRFSVARLIIIMILSLLMGFFLLLNLKLIDQTIFSLIFNIIFLIVACVLFVVSGIVLTIKKKNKY